MKRSHEETKGRATRQVFDVNVPAIKDVMQFALSPDGSRLGVLNKEIVYIFDLRAVTPAH